MSNSLSKSSPWQSGLKVAEGSTPSERNRNHNHRRASARRRCTEKITIAQYGISTTTMAEYCSGRVCPDSRYSSARSSSVESPSWQARMHEAGKDTHLPCLPMALSRLAEVYSDA
ncbi:hypothetical protein CABS01_15652 [Colletotrichum abscissum]|uniref:uncharacterized protein n=1 Tax=Colletotrichum abscissum TaxID=1671311 RepID=UPI0027D582DA|nr:uncharacterized protein CABS01_15652 [Colletotrichum abscissum]KAK1474886.1 hypothetical protein CABS01_15652 [Colletotrichum abscissum]